MFPSQQKLNFWLDNNYNVLFRGKHGVGKTHIIQQLFTERYGEQGKDWLFFSAATMDPWVDFIGVPKPVTKDGVEMLQLVRPEAFAKGTVKAIFFDELNRSSKKIRNAIMELIQFKSINGMKFPNLTVIWGAINPDTKDSENENIYDVERLDPAQQDRFQVTWDLPYAPHFPYFASKYGEDTAEIAINWWNTLPDSIKDEVSPRRLDYSLDGHSKNGALKDFLPASANPSSLAQNLSNISILKQLNTIFSSKDCKQAKAFIAIPNNFHAVSEGLLKQPEKLEFFMPFLPKDYICQVLSNDATRTPVLLDAVQHHPHCVSIISSLLNPALKLKTATRKEIQKALPTTALISHLIGSLTPTTSFTAKNKVVKQVCKLVKSTPTTEKNKLLANALPTIWANVPISKFKSDSTWRNLRALAKTKELTPLVDSSHPEVSRVLNLLAKTK